MVCFSQVVFNHIIANPFLCSTYIDYLAHDADCVVRTGLIM